MQWESVLPFAKISVISLDVMSSGFDEVNNGWDIVIFSEGTSLKVFIFQTSAIADKFPTFSYSTWYDTEIDTYIKNTYMHAHIHTRIHASISLYTVDSTKLYTSKNI